MRKIYLILALILLSANLYSQKYSSIFEHNVYGAYIDYNFNNHVIDFKKINGIPDCCVQYKDGTGKGIAFGFLFSLPISKLLNFEVRLGYFNRNGIT